MRSLRFLLTRRWLLFLLVVVLLALLAWRLGVWQFDRLDERKASNAVVARNESVAPQQVGEVLAVGEPVAEDEEWRRVTATGRYDVENTVIVRYQTRDGEAGVDVVVPLVTAEGTALLVDRGWMAADNRGADVEDVPEPPSGQVTITGWVRADDTSDATSVSDHSVRSISSEAIGTALDLKVYAGFVDLDSEDPPPAEPLVSTELPELNNGPHFFYGLQWWFFGVMALFGFVYLAYEEVTGKAARRRAQRPARESADDKALRLARARAAKTAPKKRGGRTSDGASDRAQHPAVDGEHHPGDEARRG